MIKSTSSFDQEGMIKMIREFTNSELAPGVIDRYRNSKFPKNQIRKMGKLGLMGMIVSKFMGAKDFTRNTEWKDL